MRLIVLLNIGNIYYQHLAGIITRQYYYFLNVNVYDCHSLTAIIAEQQHFKKSKLSSINLLSYFLRFISSFSSLYVD